MSMPGEVPKLPNSLPNWKRMQTEAARSKAERLKTAVPDVSRLESEIGGAELEPVGVVGLVGHSGQRVSRLFWG